MRSLLMVVMLLAVAIGIYTATIGGEDGTKSKLRGGGQAVSDRLRSLNP